MKHLRKLLFTVVILALLCLMGVIGYYAYIDIHCSRAKDYVLEKYDLNKNDLKSFKYVEYAYDDITDCNSLWFKECTSDDSLLYSYTFKYNDEEITVFENKDGEFFDYYKKDYDTEKKEDNNQNEPSVEDIIPNIPKQ